jgi:hypothetical protein
MRERAKLDTFVYRLCTQGRRHNKPASANPHQKASKFFYVPVEIKFQGQSQEISSPVRCVLRSAPVGIIRKDEKYFMALTHTEDAKNFSEEGKTLWMETSSSSCRGDGG